VKDCSGPSGPSLVKARRRLRQVGRATTVISTSTRSESRSGRKPLRSPRRSRSNSGMITRSAAARRRPAKLEPLRYLRPRSSVTPAATPGLPPDCSSRSALGPRAAVISPPDWRRWSRRSDRDTLAGVTMNPWIGATEASACPHPRDRTLSRGSGPGASLLSERPECADA
jgi:hypothetical protein